MNAMPRRGFSLVEVLVSVMLLGLVASSLTSVVLSGVRTADRSRERARQEVVLRELAAVVEREVADVSPARDLGSVAAESVTYRAGRGSGITCGGDAAGVVVRDAGYRAWRLPDASRDSLLLLLPDDSLAGGGTWVVAPMLAPPARGYCRDGAPGLHLAVDPLYATMAGAVDIPVRVFEWMRLRLYESGGAWWVGGRSLRPTDVTQPIAGPLAARGVSFTWLDGSARPAIPANAELMDLQLVSGAVLAGVGRGAAADTMHVLVGLRNGGAP